MKTPTQRLEEIAPIVVWLVITTSTVYYHFFEQEYLRIYDFLSNGFGVGLIWMPALFRAAWRYNYNAYSKACLIGIVVYDVVNLVYQGIKSYTGDLSMTDDTATIYFGLFESSAIVFATILSALFLIRNRSAGDFKG